ncbi:MAG: acetylxylan esterase [Opitutus sp.]
MTSLRTCCSFILVALVGFAPAASAAEAPQRGGIDASPSLKTAASTSAPLGPDGFLSRWWLLEPLPGEGRVTDGAVQAAAKKDYFPDQFSVLPRAGDKVTVNGADYSWHAVESNRHNVNLYHFAYFLGKPTSNVLFWGVTIVESTEDIAGVRLAVGSNSGSVWWVNGQEVIGIYGDRQTTIDDGVSRKLILKKGPNIVRFLVVQNAGMVDCCARFLDSKDQPLTRLTQTLTAHSP